MATLLIPNLLSPVIPGARTRRDREGRNGGSRNQGPGHWHCPPGRRRLLIGAHAPRKTVSSARGTGPGGRGGGRCPEGGRREPASKRAENATGLRAEIP